MQGVMPVAEILDAPTNGRRLEPEEISALFEGVDLLELGQAAGAVRRRKTGGAEATYIIDRNINYTNVCIYRCRFCAFYRPVGHDEAYVLGAEEIAEKVAETVAAGGTGILLQGGVHPDIGLEDYEEMLRRLKQSFPQIHLHAFSVPEIWYTGTTRHENAE